MNPYRFSGARLSFALRLFLLSGILHPAFGCSDSSVAPRGEDTRGGPGPDGGGGDGGGPVWWSCATPKTCGGGDCCASALVTGGTFNRLQNNAEYPATLSDFRLDLYEVTVGRFRAFVDAGKGTRASPPAPGAGARPNLSRSGWLKEFDDKLVADTAALRAAFACDDGSIESWTPAPGTQENLPMNCITWYEAFAFCAWDGGWLPTAAEWNYAAVGGNEQRNYPWGNDAIDTTRAVYGCTTQCTLADLDPVGSKSPKGDGKWGHADLVGNLWEWSLDTGASLPKPCNNCASLVADPDRMSFGGSVSSDTRDLTAWRGRTVPPEMRSYDHGVRCARPLK
ncbi:formylglycine-generating enzyme family protein [Pendulispora albinea]|uniref:Formylglycine-generating enzyme family protein n=1 Tax=Pendulispora albinea TaxID=2741071 RepID=A0ABZ2LQM9_9BACT